MLILTSEAGRDARLGGAWPGPVLFAALPGHGLRRAELRALEADAIVLDCLLAPPSPGALLCEVAARLPWLFGEQGPLLLLAAPESEDALRGTRARGLARPRAVEPRWSSEDAPGGRLDALLLGEAVAGHPLAADALALLGQKRLSDAILVEVLAAALGGEVGGRADG